MAEPRPPAWTALQIVVDRLLGCARRTATVEIDVRDPLLDLTTCPRCGTDLEQRVG